MPRIIGIDLGTTNSLVASLDGPRPAVVPNARGERMTPSVVGLDRQGRLHVGATARNQLIAMPERTVAEVKRRMGSGATVELGERRYTPTEISGFILRALKDDAERHFGEPLPEAVVTVPAYFTDAQRQATKDAGELAGFRVERILNEPTAAALAYGLEHLDKEQHVLVYDLGGGTFDVSLLEMFEGVLDVKASAGNNQLGGGDFDRAIVKWLLGEIEREHGVALAGALADDRQALARLTDAAERAKMELSALSVTTVSLPFLAMRAGQPVSVEIELSRARLEALIGDLVRSTLAPIESVLADARLGREAVSDIVLVGGSSRIPLVRSLVAEWFGKEPHAGVHPDEAVALGAAVQAGLKSGAIATETGIMITDVAPFTLGVEVQTSAGLHAVAGVFSPIIPRNQTIPVSRTEVYSTVADGQREVTVKVYQGESRFTKNNVYLDQYGIDGIPPSTAGREKIAITFAYDINGILQVTTKILLTGKEAGLTIAGSARRMTAGQKAEARARIESDWSGPGAPPARDASVAAAGGESAGETAGAAGEALRALVTAAKEALGRGAVRDRPRLAQLVADAEEALGGGDPALVARLDGELTELLFALES